MTEYEITVQLGTDIVLDNSTGQQIVNKISDLKGEDRLSLASLKDVNADNIPYGTGSGNVGQEIANIYSQLDLQEFADFVALIRQGTTELFYQYSGFFQVLTGTTVYFEERASILHPNTTYRWFIKINNVTQNFNFLGKSPFYTFNVSGMYEIYYTIGRSNGTIIKTSPVHEFVVNANSPTSFYKNIFVVNSLGIAVPDVTVTVTVNEEVVSHQTNERGLASFLLSNGDHEYTIEGTGYDLIEGAFTISSLDEDEVIILNKKLYDITFVVKDEDGVAIKGALITVGGKTGTTPANGTIKIEDLEYGLSVLYSVICSGYETALSAIDIIANATENVELSAVESETELPTYFGYTTSLQTSTITEAIVLGIAYPTQRAVLTSEGQADTYPNVIKLFHKTKWHLASFTPYTMWVCAPLSEDRNYTEYSLASFPNNFFPMTTGFHTYSEYSISIGGNSYKMFVFDYDALDMYFKIT